MRENDSSTRCNYSANNREYGHESWCNLEGQYLHIVSDDLSSTGSNDIGLCHLGILGTKYIRDQELVSAISVIQGESLTLDI